MREGEPGLPMCWHSRTACREFNFEDVAVTLDARPGGFQYHPLYRVWMCPPEFLGRQSYIGLFEQRYPANFMADGPGGILFLFEMGDNDWKSAPDDIARALGMERPKITKKHRKAVQPFLLDLTLPEGVTIKVFGFTSSSILLSYNTDAELSNESVDKITTHLVKKVRKHFPELTRLVLARMFSQGFDAEVIGLGTVLPVQ